MNLIKYRAFIKTAEYGSLTKAAKDLKYSQPGISKMIETLENEWDISLFSKNRSYMELTDNGKQLYSYCKEIIRIEDELNDTVNAMHGLLTGYIRIGALNSIIIDFVPNVIKTYTNTYPIIQISLNELNSFDVVSHLKENMIDIGFTSKFSEKGLEFIPLFRDPIRLIVNKEHPFAVYDKVPISALNGCEFIMLPPEGQDLITVVKKRERFQAAVKFHVHSDIAAISMVAANLGAYIISDMQCNNLPDNVVKKEFQEDVYRVMGIGMRNQKTISPALRELINIAKSRAACTSDR